MTKIFPRVGGCLPGGHAGFIYKGSARWLGKIIIWNQKDQDTRNRPHIEWIGWTIALMFPFFEEDLIFMSSSLWGVVCGGGGGGPANTALNTVGNINVENRCSTLTENLMRTEDYSCNSIIIYVLYSRGDTGNFLYSIICNNTLVKKTTPVKLKVVCLKK